MRNFLGFERFMQCVRYNMSDSMYKMQYVRWECGLLFFALCIMCTLQTTYKTHALANPYIDAASMHKKWCVLRTPLPFHKGLMIYAENCDMLGCGLHYVL